MELEKYKMLLFQLYSSKENVPEYYPAVIKEFLQRVEKLDVPHITKYFQREAQILKLTTYSKIFCIVKNFFELLGDKVTQHKEIKMWFNFYTAPRTYRTYTAKKKREEKEQALTETLFI